jgi:hypothetical protein
VRSLPTKWCVRHRPRPGDTPNCFFVSLQQFVLLIQQVQAPEDLVTLPPVPSPQTAPTTPLPVSTTNTSPTRTPTNGQTTNPSSASLLPSTAPQRLPGQGVPWLSVLRFIIQFVWYDEHNRICMPASPLSLPLFDYERMSRVLHIHRTRPRRTRHGRARTWGCLSRLAVRIHLGTTDHACCAPWKALRVGKKLYHRDDCGKNVAGHVYAFSFRQARFGLD